MCRGKDHDVSVSVRRVVVMVGGQELPGGGGGEGGRMARDGFASLAQSGLVYIILLLSGLPQLSTNLTAQEHCPYTVRAEICL